VYHIVCVRTVCVTEAGHLSKRAADEYLLFVYVYIFEYMCIVMYMYMLCYVYLYVYVYECTL
jgi:hypothetical protein